MIQPALIKLVVVVVIFVFATGILATGGKVELSWFRFYSIAIIAVTSLLALWNQFFWSFGIFQRLYWVPRRIHGTWKGVLTSLWVNPSTGVCPPPKPVYLVVRQTASTISVVLLTSESRSTSFLGKISHHEGTSTLNYMYLNHPDSNVEDQSRMHPGATSLMISGLPSKKMKGRYWTDRESRGELEFKDYRMTLADDFESAEELFGTATKV